MKMMDRLLRSLISLISSRIWAWMVTSRAVVGSSQIRISGSLAKAMAMTIRWRMPPENWKGYWLKRISGWGMPTRRIKSRAFSLASPLGVEPLRTRASTICLPIFIMGLRADRGSWNTREIFFPRISAKSLSWNLARSAPL